MNSIIEFGKSDHFFWNQKFQQLFNSKGRIPFKISYIILGTRPSLTWKYLLKKLNRYQYEYGYITLKRLCHIKDWLTLYPIINIHTWKSSQLSLGEYHIYYWNDRDQVHVERHNVRHEFALIWVQMPQQRTIKKI